MLCIYITVRYMIYYMVMPAYSQAVGSQTTLLQDYLPTSRTIPQWGKGDPPISVTGMLPRPLGKT